MNTPSISINTVVGNYALSTLEETPSRALEFLRGIGSTPVIMKLMSGAGYSAEVHAEGIRLLGNVVSFIEQRQAFSVVTSATHKGATAELETWCKTVYRRLEAATTRFYPDVASSLFANLAISDEMDASLLASIFLDRLSEQKVPKGVLKLFAERNFGPEEMHHLKKLVGVAQAPAPQTEEATSTKPKETRLQMLAELRAWYDDWSAAARTIVTRRDHQIRIGIAHRRAKSGSTPPPPPVVVAPVAAAAPPVAPAPVVVPFKAA